MSEKYFNYLVEQFKEATGVKNVDVNSEFFISELYDWINRRMNMAGGYLDLLNYMQLDVSGRDTAEIDKGKYDSVVIMDSLLDTTIITPFSNGMEFMTENHIITSDFRVLGGLPILLSTDDKNNTFLYAIDSEIVLTYMTQNPYTQGHIANWEKLHNSGEYNIIVGIYGNVFDKDKVEKIRELRDLGSKLNDHFIVEHNTIGDTYYLVVASKKNVKKLKKFLTK